MIETELRTFIIAQLPSIYNSRIYPGILPQSVTLPALTYNRIDTEYNADLSGAIDHKMTAIQLTAVSDGIILTRADADALIDLLHGYKGLLDTVTALGIFVVGDNDLGYDNEEASDAKRYAIAIDIEIHYND